MAGLFSSAPTPGYSDPNNSNEILRSIERNTANTLQWTKYLTVAVVVLVVVLAFALI